MVRRRGCPSLREEETAIPVQSFSEEEMPMRRYTHTIPAAQPYGGTEQQLQKLCQALTVQNDAIHEILSVMQELLEVLKAQEQGPGQ